LSIAATADSAFRKAGEDLGVAQQLLAVPRRSLVQHLGGSGDLRFPLLRLGRCCGHLEPGQAGQFLDRVHERQAAGIGQPADGVAVRAAAKAMIKRLVVADREAGRLFVVKRAAGLKFAPFFFSLTDLPISDDSVVRDRSAVEPFGG
jgi:hypothetical protein